MILINFPVTSFILSSIFKNGFPFSFDALIERPISIENTIKAIMLSFDNNFSKSFVLIVFTVRSKMFKSSFSVSTFFSKVSLIFTPSFYLLE